MKVRNDILDRIGKKEYSILKLFAKEYFYE